MSARAFSLLAQLVDQRRPDAAGRLRAIARSRRASTADEEDIALRTGRDQTRFSKVHPYPYLVLRAWHLVRGRPFVHPLCPP